jgi:hypothetical protein
MNTCFVLALVLTATSPGRSTRAAILPFESAGNPTLESRIDTLVLSKLKRLGVRPAPICSDAVFVRRLYLDMLGTLPTAQEAREFLADQNAKKRRVLIDQVLERKEFADYWAMKWCDLLRVKSEYPINLWPNAVQAYHRWIRTCIKENMPYDQFVRQMLTASGSDFYVPQVNFYRALQSREPTAIAQTVALTFMGVRAASWPGERWSQMSVFFSRISYKATEQWKEEIIQFDPGKGSAGSQANDPVQAVFPDGTPVQILPDQDPREVFARWLTDAKNPWLARKIVNHVWCWLLGRGIVHEPDDMRRDNLASNPELLDYLERQLVSAHYDLKHVYRLILNSRTYQLSSIPDASRSQDDAHFCRYLPRRLDAEVLIDAICKITGTTEDYSSQVPEPFTFIPKELRSIELPDGSISSSFLEMFGRPPRDTGLEAERNSRPTAAQELHLLNSTHIRSKIEQSPALRSLVQSTRNPREIADAVYLTILSRYPTDDELRTLREFARAGQPSQPWRPGEQRRLGEQSRPGQGRPGGQNFQAPQGRRPMMDLVWALLNSAEFLYRH